MNDDDLLFTRNNDIKIIHETSMYKVLSNESDIKLGNFLDIFIQIRPYHNNFINHYHSKFIPS